MDMDSRRAKAISDLCLKHFERRISSKGKPKLESREWTVLSCIVEERSDCLRVVALGTGSKCLGRKEIGQQGEKVRDSHAEVVTRRSFLLYLLHHLNLSALNDKDSIFEAFDAGRTRLKDGIRYHFFTTHPPCGDATIAPIPTADQAKRPRLDMTRTGAKCLDSDPLGTGVDNQTLGVLRTKPGRGDPTRSLSCSDKMMKWNLVGLQGTLLSKFIREPIRFASVIVSGAGHDAGSISRALYLRTNGVGTAVDVYLTGEDGFPFGKPARLHDSDRIGSSSSIAWWENGQQQQVVVDGRKQGCVKKHFGTDKAQVKICETAVSKEVVKLFKLVNKEDIRDGTTYSQLKSIFRSEEYARNLERLYDVFPSWPRDERSGEDFIVVPETDTMAADLHSKRRRVVWLFKADSLSTDDKYKTELDQQGFETYIIPVLTFKFCNQKELQARLEQFSHYCGIIFTSPRSVEAVHAVGNKVSSLSRWETIYCVGEATKDLIKRKLGLDALGSETGNASQLSDFILSHSIQHESKRLLFPCGNLRQETLPAKLTEAGFVVDALTAYETHPHPGIDEDVAQFKEPDFAVYFSPSGVKFTHEDMEFRFGKRLPKFVALGPSSEKALREVGFEVAAVAKRPTVDDVVKAIHGLR